MDEPRNSPEFPDPQESPREMTESSPAQLSAEQAQDIPHLELQLTANGTADSNFQAVAQNRALPRKLFLALGMALVAFALTTWMFLRMDAPFGTFTSGPQQVVKAQLRALELGELKPAYDMFSQHYRDQVSFEAWHELVVTHWGMFHASVVRTDEPWEIGSRVNLEIYLRGGDDKNYRARFTVVRAAGRWWIDDVHWSEAPDPHDIWTT